MGHRRSLTLGLATGGVVIGHAIAYALAYPASPEREARLGETGHHGFQILLVVGTISAGATLALILLRAARRAGALPSVRTLMLLQVGLFLSLELSERGFDLGRAVADPAVAIGVAVQLALAFVLVWLAEGAAVVGRRLVESGHRVAPLPERSTGSDRVAEPGRPDPIALGPRRAPPSLSVL